MGEEEFIDVIMDIDVLLMQIQSDIQQNNNTKAINRLRQARVMIADMQESGDYIQALNILK